MSKVLPFASEADLCRAFLTWVSATAPDVTAYSEWAGWDILLAYPEGFQLGIQAKLRLNAEVIGQAAPGLYDDAGDCGPDFRGVLVPANNGLSAIAGRLGLVVFAPLGYRPGDFNPDIRYEPRRSGYHGAWLDWNPRKRHDLPPTVTDAIAGSSAPVSLTPWKLRALHVLAEIALRGPITTKRVRELGVDPRRWLENGWLVPVGERERGGLWCRGESCPRFDEQHPTAYQHAVTERGGDA